MDSAYIFLQLFTLAHVHIQVTSFHTGEEFEPITKLRKTTSCTTMHCNFVSPTTLLKYNQFYLNKVVGMTMHSVT